MFKKILISLALISISFGLTASADRDILAVPFDKNSWLTTDFKLENQTQWKYQTWDWLDIVDNTIMKIVQFLVKWMWLFAFWFLMYAGFILVAGQWTEDEINTQKRQIRWSIIALTLTFIIEPIVRNVFFWGWKTLKPWDAIFSDAAAKQWVLEIQWAISYVETFVAIIALYMLIQAALKVFFAQDQEDAIENQKKSLIWIWIWIVVIALSKIMVYYWVYWNPVTGEVASPLKVIQETSWVIKYFLWFVAAIAIALIAYWGFLIVASNWDDEKIETWKKIVLNIAIWSIIIAVSYWLIATLIVGQS